MAALLLPHLLSADEKDTLLDRWTHYATDSNWSESWSEQVEHYQNLSHHWSQFEEAVRTKYQHVLSSELTRLCEPDQNVDLNPWKSASQETHYAPPLGEVRFIDGPPVQQYGGTDTKRRIPAIFRLAELLTLGTNSMSIAFSRIDPSFELLEDSGYAIANRMRNDLIGLFHPQDGSAAIETLRLSLESTFPLHFAILRMEPDTPSRRFGIEYVNQRRAYVSDSYVSRPWERHRIGARLPDHAVEIRPSKTQDDARKARIQALETEIETTLRHLQSRLLTHLHQAFEDKYAPTLATSIQSLRDWESQADGERPRHQWNPRLILPSQVFSQTSHGTQVQAPPELAHTIAQAQIGFAFRCLLNGLRLRLAQPQRNEATEDYLAFVTGSPMK